jgi:hypothetical protein
VAGAIDLDVREAIRVGRSTERLCVPLRGGGDRYAIVDECQLGPLLADEEH